jgi:hypothetical protein
VAARRRFLAVLIGGSLLGAAQGSLVAWLKIPPFIVTLGGMLLFQGALLGITGGSHRLSVAAVPLRRSDLRAAVAGLAGDGTDGGGADRERHPARGHCALEPSRFRGARPDLHRGHERVRGASRCPCSCSSAWPPFFSGVASHTRFGRHLYAIGGNREAAFYSGISIEKHIIGVFTLMGFLSAVAGIVLTARVGAATSDAGRIMELDAIAAAVIGGTSLLGGQGTVWGALLGALVMASPRQRDEPDEHGRPSGSRSSRARSSSPPSPSTWRGGAPAASQFQKIAARLSGGGKTLTAAKARHQQRRRSSASCPRPSALPREAWSWACPAPSTRPGGASMQRWLKSARSGTPAG